MTDLGSRLRIWKTNLARESSKLVRKTLAPRGMRELPPKYPQDFSPYTRDLWDKVRPHTMTSQARIANLERAVRYIVEQGTISPKADANWTFAPLPGTSVLFDTGPSAAGYADAVSGVSITPAGEGPDGFARFKIDL